MRWLPKQSTDEVNGTFWSGVPTDATSAQRHLQEVQDIRGKMQGTYGFLQEELQQMRNRLDELNSTLNTSSLDVDANYSMV